MGYQGHPDQRWGHTTYSQHGEDLMLLNIFEQLEISKPSYLDLGAHHPINISNTHLLYTRGSRGVNVEANPSLIGSFKAYRPEDTTVNIGIGTQDGFFDFYMYDETSGRNTFCKEKAYSKNKVIKLPMTTLQKIVVQYCDSKYPDILSMDLEDLDFDVLSSTPLPINNRPDIICVEVRPSETKKFRKMMFDKHYSIYCRCGENILFVNARCLDLLY